MAAMDKGEVWTPADEPARDVLAAEAFAVPARDPGLHRVRGEEPAHDVLAAEAFAVPAPDPRLHHAPMPLPDDPLGTSEPHGVLAAEEFPMPAAPSQHVGAALVRGARSQWPVRAATAGAALLGAVAMRLVRRR